MCIIDFVYEVAEKVIFPSQGELTTLTTVGKLKAEAGHMMPPYNSAEHEDSEPYRLNPGNVGNLAPIEYQESEEKDIEAHSAECISINDAREGGNSGSGISDINEPRIPTDDDIAIRARAGIVATFPTTYDSLMMCLSRNTSHPPTNRRYINLEAASAYKRQHQLLLTITEHLGLPKGDKEAFALMERHERAVYRRRRSLKTIKEIRRKKSELI